MREVLKSLPEYIWAFVVYGVLLGLWLLGKYGETHNLASLLRIKIPEPRPSPEPLTRGMKVFVMVAVVLVSFIAFHRVRLERDNTMADARRIENDAAQWRTIAENSGRPDEPSGNRSLRISTCTNAGIQRTLIEMIVRETPIRVSRAAVLLRPEDASVSLLPGVGDSRQPCAPDNLIRIAMGTYPLLSPADEQDGWQGVSFPALDVTPQQSVYLMITGNASLEDCFLESVEDGSRTYCSDHLSTFH